MSELEKLFKEYNAGVDRAVRAYARTTHGPPADEAYAADVRASRKAKRYRQRQALKAEMPDG